MKRLLSAMLAAALMLLCCAGAQASALAATPLNDSPAAKVYNVELAAASINGTRLESGDSFSFNDAVGVRTRAEGYKAALNGRGVRVVGGGVAQVATTLYLAIQDDDNYEITEKRVYGNKFSDDYVDSGSDAILTDDDAGIDFCFTYWGEEPVTIESWVDEYEVMVQLVSEGAGGSGYAATPISEGSALLNNIELAAAAISGTQLTSYGEFSFNGIVGPRTSSRGYESAVNGRGVKVVGGGVAQVASTVYLAVRDLDCVEITQKRTYGSKYVGDYVSDSSDAILTDYSADIDFAFTYTGDGVLTLDVYLWDGQVCCEAYEE